MSVPIYTCTEADQPLIAQRLSALTANVTFRLLQDYSPSDVAVYAFDVSSRADFSTIVQHLVSHQLLSQQVLVGVPLTAADDRVKTAECLKIASKLGLKYVELTDQSQIELLKRLIKVGRSLDRTVASTIKASSVTIAQPISFASDAPKPRVQQQIQQKLFHSNTPLVLEVAFTQNNLKKTGYVVVKVGSDPGDLASKFCQQFGLGQRQFDSLAELITENMKKTGYITTAEAFPGITGDKPKGVSKIVRIQFGLRQKVYCVGDLPEVKKKILDDFGLDEAVYGPLVDRQLRV